jgi:transcriptional regulator with XRE-family HTH domain
VFSRSAIREYWGNVSPVVKEHIPRALWNSFPMAKRPAPRLIIAANLKALIAHHKTTSPAVAEKAGVDRKTLNNILNARYNPDLDILESVGQVFGLNSWQLLRHDLKDTLGKIGDVDKLIEDYMHATDDGRDKIMGIAEMAASYKPK